MDLGLEATGWVTGFCTDIDPHSVITLQWGRAEAAKRGKKILTESLIYRSDVKEIDAHFILEAIRRKKDEVHLLAGGPPCQAFSVFGKRRGREDHRGLLAYEYLRLLAELEPQAFVFENVYGIMTVEGGEVFTEICKKIGEPKKGLKYSLSVLRLDAVDYGVPQFRDRVFIIGSRNGKTIAQIPKITSQPGTSPFEGPRSWRTVRHALRGLPVIGTEPPANHTGRNHSQRIIERYASMRPGERDHFTRINKLDLDRPSFTIIVGSDKGGGKGHIHPIKPREVTPRESARIQTFPDWWAFAGTGRHPIRQIGNAVPPLLAAAVGNVIRSQIFGLEPVPFETILQVLDQTHLFQEEK